MITKALALREQRDKAQEDALFAALDEGEAVLREGRFVGFRGREELDAFSPPYEASKAAADRETRSYVDQTRL